MAITDATNSEKLELLAQTISNLVTNSIYGIDIDPKAISIAKCAFGYVAFLNLTFIFVIIPNFIIPIKIDIYHSNRHFYESWF